MSAEVYIWKIFFPRKHISRDEKLSAINAFFDEMLPSVGGVQPGGILTQSLTVAARNRNPSDSQSKSLRLAISAYFGSH
jgi:hypothetical protein